MESYLFPAKVGTFAFILKTFKVFFPVCTLTWLVNSYISRQGRGTDRRNETTFIINIVDFVESISHFVIQLTVIWLETIPQSQGKPF